MVKWLGSRLGSGPLNMRVGGKCDNDIAFLPRALFDPFTIYRTSFIRPRFT